MGKDLYNKKGFVGQDRNMIKAFEKPLSKGWARSKGQAGINFLAGKREKVGGTLALGKILIYGHIKCCYLLFFHKYCCFLCVY